MKKSHLCMVLAAMVVLCALVGGGCGKRGDGASSATAQKKFTLAVIPKGSTHEHWKSVHAGAIKAAQELAQNGAAQVDVIWKGPIREDDREQQIQVVEGFTSQGVSGIILAPLDSRALVRPVEEAARAGIPTVVFDSALESPNIVSYVATDNKKGGMLAADRMGEALGGRGKVLMLRYQEGSASTEERERGFVEEIKAKYPAIELVSTDQYSGATRDTAKSASENLLNQFGDQLQGIFTVNESSTAGMLLALQDLGKAGKIVFVGFDNSPAFVEAMSRKQMQGFIVQNPINMGYLSVKMMVAHLQGANVEKQIDTGVSLVTPENLNDAQIQELLHPPLAQYLK